MVNIAQIRESYEEIAEVYDKSRERPWIKPLLSAVLEALRLRPRRVIDVGCGSGGNATYISSLASLQYIGIDFSLRMLQTLQRKLDLAKCDLICADARSLPLRDKISDLVTQIAIIHNIPLKENRVRAIQEALRVLSERGLLVVTCWDREVIHLLPDIKPGEEQGSYLVKWSWGLSKSVYRYYYFYTASELVEDLELAIFQMRRRLRLVLCGKFRKGRFTNIVVAVYTTA